MSGNHNHPPHRTTPIEVMCNPPTKEVNYNE
uniref:Uncharacterized protein n=2 Tax=root TaxID=1 RepID=Q9V2V2_METTF|nr:unknown protein [Plasmid pME2001]AAF00125.1 unknown [Methanothermobacter thermautotrophicus]